MKFAPYVLLAFATSLAPAQDARWGIQALVSSPGGGLADLASQTGMDKHGR